MKRIIIRIGDIFEIPLPNGKKAFGQYVSTDKRIGELIKIWDYFINKDEDVRVEELKRRKLLFPMVLTSVHAGVKTGVWKIIENIPVKNFEYPKFISTFINHTTGEHGYWFLVDNEKSIRLGKELPDEYKNLEFQAIYSPDLIKERILTGKKPYMELIETNKMTIPTK